MSWIPAIESIGDLAPPYGIAISISTYQSIEVALKTLLVNDGAVGDIVGDRVFPTINMLQLGDHLAWIPAIEVIGDIMPPFDSPAITVSGLPAVVYNQITGYREQTMANAVGMVDSRFQMNCWAATYIESIQLVKAVRLALNNFSGISNGVFIYVIMAEAEIDIPDFSEIRTTFGKALDFKVWFKEHLN